MSVDKLTSLKEQLNKNHLEVCQRLTSLETTLNTAKELYTDIPKRITKLEKFDERIKVVGGIAGAGLAAVWAAILVLIRKL